MLRWEVLDTGRRSAGENMALDGELLASLKGEARPVLHLYDWERPSATHGYFLDPGPYLRENVGLDLARRPTGGGLLFHTADLAFSVLLPAGHPGDSLNVLERYRWVNRRVARAIELFGAAETDLLPEDPQPQTEGAADFCMAKPTIYDIVVGQRKVGGAAQRRKRWGLLHQGTISLGALSQEFLQDVMQERAIAEEMGKQTYALLGMDWSEAELTAARQELKGLLQRVFVDEE